MSDEWHDPTYARKVGDRLRSVRKQKGMSLQAVEAESGKEFKASVLGAYERGERSISVPRLQRLARIYNVPVDQLLPREAELGSIDVIDLTSGDRASSGQGAAAGDGAAPGAGYGASTQGGGKVVIDLSRLEAMEGPERELLRRYLGSIQVQRQDFNGRVLTIREEDVRAIARLFDLSVDAMRERLDDLGLCFRR